MVTVPVDRITSALHPVTVTVTPEAMGRSAKGSAKGGQLAARFQRSFGQAPQNTTTDCYKSGRT
eukprot:9372795-Pyramimonas_sp.AAC.1